MKPERRTYHTFLGETLEYQESQQIDPATLDLMVTKLREGDRTQINPIIIGHLRLVMGIVADSVRSRRRAGDIEGAAFLALVEAVNNACPHFDKKGKFWPSRLYDNKITYYITSTVKYAIKDEYGNDHVMRMPARTIRYKISNGEKFEDIVPGDGLDIGEDQPDEEMAATSGIMPFYIPLARIEFPAIEFTEALNRSVENETERAILKCRSEGNTYEETAKLVGLSTPRVGQIVPMIEARFDRNFK